MQYGPDFWLGPLAMYILPIINKNKAALFCNNDSPGLLSRQAWSEAYGLSKKYFLSLITNSLVHLGFQLFLCKEISSAKRQRVKLQLPHFSSWVGHMEK